jgi:adenylylsulfate kinase
LETCIDRDPKGLYAKSKSGIIKKMTGIDSDFELPVYSNIEINEFSTVEESTTIIFDLIIDKLAITNE